MAKRDIFILLVLISMFSCKKEKTTSEIAKIEPLGKYFELKKDNIKLFLPPSFQEFSEYEYGKLIDSLPDSKEKTIEKNRFNYLKYSKGNVYYFRDQLSPTLFNVKMMKYTPITKKESSYLLGLLSQFCSNYADAVNANCQKITAGFSCLSRVE